MYSSKKDWCRVDCHLFPAINSQNALYNFGEEVNCRCSFYLYGDRILGGHNEFFLNVVLWGSWSFFVLITRKQILVLASVATQEKRQEKSNTRKRRKHSELQVRHELTTLRVLVRMLQPLIYSYCSLLRSSFINHTTYSINNICK